MALALLAPGPLGAEAATADAIGDTAAVSAAPAGGGGPTFDREIAPILFQHCAVCHRSGRLATAAPFPLLTYAEAKKHAKDIVAATKRRYMPPWLPAPGVVDYLDPRRLTDREIQALQDWLAAGAPEGNPADLPAPPQWPEGWQLGQPDLVVSMPEAYNVPAEGRDIYRSFAIRLPGTETRYVVAVEFQPDNPRVVHHAGMGIDPTTRSREQDEKDPEPGFDGMNVPDTMVAPDGHFLNWQPGKLPYRSPPEMAWVLRPGADLVLQLHLHPTGKPEKVQSRIGLFFTPNPPTRKAFRLVLDNPMIDLPPGVTNGVIEDHFTLPADVEALAIFPHAHYLCKVMETFAELPDGSTRWLLRINDWDFNWQGDYRFAQPVALPAGTRIAMRFTYDNSAGNVRNPHHPPRRVRFGTQTDDEMGEVWLQLLPRDNADFDRIAQAYHARELEKLLAEYEAKVKEDPQNAPSQLMLGKTLLMSERYQDALGHLATATTLDPNLADAHYFLGLVHRVLNHLEPARQEFERAVALDPNHFKAHGNLGYVYLELGKLARAELHFRKSLALNPGNDVSLKGLAEIQRLKNGGPPGAK